MAQQPLREVLDELRTGDGDLDVAGHLADHGYGDLSPELVLEALGSYAATLPVDAAEHLSQFLVAASPVPGGEELSIDAIDGLRALAEIPAEDFDPDPPDTSDLDSLGSGSAEAPPATPAEDPLAALDAAASADSALDLEVEDPFALDDLGAAADAFGVGEVIDEAGVADAVDDLDFFD